MWCHFCGNQNFNFWYDFYWTKSKKCWYANNVYWSWSNNCLLFISKYKWRNYKYCWRFQKELALGKNHKNLLNNLEKLRKKTGITQQELSERVEVSRKSINAIENGIYVPSTVLALKISRTLGCKVEDLFKLPNTK